MSTCHLNEGSYSMTVAQMSVAVEGGKVVAGPNVPSTCFFFAKRQSGEVVCAYNIFTDPGQSAWAEYSEPGGCIYIESNGNPRSWTITSLGGDTYTIAPGPPSPNAWTAPAQDGQICLETLREPPTAYQEFVITPC